MGLGQFGGGLGAVQYLLSQGADVTVTDLRPAEALQDSLARIDGSQLRRLILGEHQEQDFLDADLIVVNPAVHQAENPFLKLARERGIGLTSEMNLFWERCRGRKILVTGSVGKSTTATLIHQFLQAGNRTCRLGGNLGVSLLPEVDRIHEEDFVVLELSSFQLADLDRLHPAPEIAVVTNFYPNHLDWHGNLDHYRDAKQTAIAWQNANQMAVLNGDDPDSSLWPTDARVIWFGREIWRDRPGIHFTADEITVRSPIGGWKIHEIDLAPSLRHEHGFSNVAAALAVAVIGLEIPVPCLADVLKNYVPLPHRLEQVAEVQGRIFINDSKATTPESTLAALKSVSGPIILIVGGKDKGSDLSRMAAAIAQRAKIVLCLGDTASELIKKISAEQSNTLQNVIPSRNLNEAVQAAWQMSQPGDVLLFSPGCASHAEFANYERRGERFVECVKQIDA